MKIDDQRSPRWEEEISSQLAQVEGGSAWAIRCFEQVGSTMESAAELVQVVPPPLLVLARAQRAGQGRQGRVWSSPPGGFYGTMVLALTADVAERAGLSLAVGVMIGEALDELGVRLLLKWPNDLYTPYGEKVGGILVRSLTISGAVLALVGVGINVNRAPEAVPHAAALNELGAGAPHSGFSVTQCASVICPALGRGWSTLMDEGFDVFRERWRSRALWRGRELEIELDTERIRGVFLDIDSRGCMLLQTESGVRTVVSGHVIPTSRAVG